MSRLTVRGLVGKAPAGLIFILAFLAIPQVSWSQASSAAVNGTVRDSTGAVVPGATVMLRNMATNVALRAVTNSVGEYVILLIPPGRYTLRVTKEGFETVEQAAFTLDVNQTTAFDFVLSVGTTVQNVTVQAAAANIETSTAELGAVVGEKMVNDLPLNGRNFTELLELTTGASPINVSQNSYAEVPTGTYIFPAVNGQQNRSSRYILDGISDNSEYIASYNIAPQIDDILEFKVMSHNDEAQFGAALGGITNIVTKSGTNAIHGDGYDFLRNRALDARGFFLPPTQPKQAYTQNQFGGTVGGPVVIPHLFNGKDKTFFFASYEGFRRDTAASILYRVPTPAELSGDLSDFKDSSGNLIQIYNPFSTRPDPNHPGYSLLDPFPNNQIPSNLISPQMAAYASIFPAPINTGIAAYNGLDTSVSTFRQDQPSIRFDEQASSHDNIFIRYTGSAQRLFSSAGMVGAKNTDFIHGYNATVTYAHTFTGSAVATFAFGRDDMVYSTPEELTNVPANFFSNTGFDSSLVGGFIGGYTLVPEVIMAQFPSVQQTISNVNATDVWQWKGDFSKLWRHHTFKMGVDLRTINVRDLIDNSDVGFASTETSCAFCYAASQGAAPGGVAFASFLLGVPDNAGRRSTLATTHGGWVDSLYFQDQWKATDKLTINLGLRYDLPLEAIYGRASDRSDTTGIVDFTNGTYIIQSQPPACNPPSIVAPCIPVTAATPTGSLPAHVVVTPHSNHQLYNNPHDNWGPRAGFAYHLRPKLVVRGSYGRFFDAGTAAAELSQGLEGTWPQIGQLLGQNLNVNAVPTVSATNPFAGAASAGIPAPSPFVSSGFLHWYRNPVLEDAFSDQWTLGIQQQLGANTVLTANYVGSEDQRLNEGGDYNVATYPAPGDAATVTSRQPYPYIPATYYERYIGRSNYEAFQFSLNRKTSKGFAYLLSYTYAKSMSENCDGIAGVEGCSNQNPYNLRGDRSVSAFDLTNILSYAWVYQLPFGKGMRWSTSNRGLDYLVGNWQFNGIFYTSSGTPFYVNASSPVENTGNTVERADRLAGVSPFANKGGAAPSGHVNWLNTAAFTNPAPFTFGTEGRYDLRSDWPRNFDLSLFRSFPFTESKRLDFRVEWFNAFNTPLFGQPDNTVGDQYFGQVSTQANVARQIQLSLKLIF